MDGSGVSRQTGTSFAAPQVSGAAGLLFAFDSSLTAAGARSLLIAAAERSGRRAGGYPLLDVNGALRAAGARVGGALCGNRFWFADNHRLVVERRAPGSTTFFDDTIVRYAPYSWPNARTIFTSTFYHGGHRIDFNEDRDVTDQKTASFKGGQWVVEARQPAPSDSGLLLGGGYAEYGRVSHDGDSVVVTHSGGTTNAPTYAIGLAKFGTVPASYIVPETSGELRDVAYPVVGHEMFYLVGAAYADTAVIRAVDTRTGVTRDLASVVSPWNIANAKMLLSEDGTELMVVTEWVDPAPYRCVADYRSSRDGALLRRVIMMENVYDYCWNTAWRNGNRMATLPAVR
jgi:hypothetical protein